MEDDGGTDATFHICAVLVNPETDAVLIKLIRIFIYVNPSAAGAIEQRRCISCVKYTHCRNVEEQLQRGGGKGGRMCCYFTEVKYQYIKITYT